MLSENERSNIEILRQGMTKKSSLDQKKLDMFKNWLLEKRIHIFCPIIMKLGENNHLMR